MPFRPPAPMSMDGYFDKITENKAVKFTSIYQIDIDPVLRVINARRDSEEKFALLAILAQRLTEFGKVKGYIETKFVEPSPNNLSLFIVQDILGLEKKDVGEKIYDEFVDITKEFVKDGLNARGRKAFSFLEIIWKLMNCSTAGEAARVLGSAGFDKLSDLMIKYAPTLAKTAMKKVGVGRAVRNRVMRVLALKTVLLKAAPKLIARLNIVVTALDLILTPSEIASDADEERLGFYAIYGKVTAEQNTIFANLISTQKGAPPSSATLSMPLGHALGMAIGTSP